MTVATPVIAVTVDFADFPKFALWKDMFRGLVAAGAAPLAIDCGQSRTDWETLLADVDGLLITGGTDVDPRLYGGDPSDPIIHSLNPARDNNEIAAYRVALSRELPILAICRGAQLVNVVRGGSLVPDLLRDRPGSDMHWHAPDALGRAVHKITVVPGTVLANWLATSGEIAVNSQHHQGLAELAPGLCPVAHSPDGLVEAFELPGRNVLGVQWHPEVLWRTEDHALRLLTSFSNISANQHD